LAALYLLPGLLQVGALAVTPRKANVSFNKRYANFTIVAFSGRGRCGRPGNKNYQDKKEGEKPKAA